MVNNKAITSEFLRGAEEALSRDGFFTDEHEFSPYKKDMVNNFEKMESALNKTKKYRLHHDVLTVSKLGDFYYIFDRNKLTDEAARKSVTQWIRDGLDAA